MTRRHVAAEGKSLEAVAALQLKAEGVLGPLAQVPASLPHLAALAVKAEVFLRNRRMWQKHHVVLSHLSLHEVAKGVGAAFKIALRVVLLHALGLAGCEGLRRLSRIYLRLLQGVLAVLFFGKGGATHLLKNVSGRFSARQHLSILIWLFLTFFLVVLVVSVLVVRLIRDLVAFSVKQLLLEGA